MKKNIFLVTMLVLLSSYTHATPSLGFNQGSITIKTCNYIETNNAFDLALINKGYFVLKRGKGNLFYTRYGAFSLNSENYLKTTNGDYVQGIVPNSHSNALRNIQIPMDDMGPRTTDRLDVRINLNASTEINHEFQISSTIYDSLGSAHVLTSLIKKQNPYIWQASIEIDSQVVTTGQLIFDQAGKLISQSSLHEFQWASPHGVQVLTMSFKGSTQYDSPSTVMATHINGNTTGCLTGLRVTADGELELLYTNGQDIKLDQNLAVAFFDNPKKLRKVTDNLYVSNASSGPGSVQPSNSYSAILSGYLEEKPCLPKD